MAVTGGLPVWAAVAISMTNVTSAGQFAGLEFKARRIADFAGSDDGRPLFADNNGVAVLKADMRHGAFQC